MANANLFVNAAAQSTCSGTISSGATSITLLSTSAFGTMAANTQIGAIIIDTGNPAYSSTNPLATPYEYVYITANNLGTNTLTVIRAQESTSATSFFAGATVGAELLAGVLNNSMARIDMTGLFTQGFGTTGSVPTLSNVPAGITNAAISGNDIAGTIRLDTTAGPPSAGRVVTITFATAKLYAPKFIGLSPSNNESGNTNQFNGFINRPYVSNRSTTLWELSFAAPQASTSSEFDFLVVM
jgi:hypothetical protein